MLPFVLYFRDQRGGKTRVQKYFSLWITIPGIIFTEFFYVSCCQATSSFQILLHFSEMYGRLIYRYWDINRIAWLIFLWFMSKSGEIFGVKGIKGNKKMSYIQGVLKFNERCHLKRCIGMKDVHYKMKLSMTPRRLDIMLKRDA